MRHVRHPHHAKHCSRAWIWLHQFELEHRELPQPLVRRLVAGAEQVGDLRRRERHTLAASMIASLAEVPVTPATASAPA
ncbi:MAG TPA: hypothetical protein VIK04_11290 [Solirubrobacteraceae bacterium]